jgi:hypothetical protein
MTTAEDLGRGLDRWVLDLFTSIAEDLGSRSIVTSRISIDTVWYSSSAYQMVELAVVLYIKVLPCYCSTHDRHEKAFFVDSSKTKGLGTILEQPRSGSRG